MAKIAWQGLTLPALWLAWSITANAQDAATVLQPAAEALRVADVRTVRLVASGSAYERQSERQAQEAPSALQSLAATAPAASPPPPTTEAGLADAIAPSSAMDVPPPAPPPRSYFRIVSHVEEVDLAEESVAIEESRAQSSSPDAQRRPAVKTTIGADADWSERHRYWLTPHAFIAGALARTATVGTETVGGTDYRVVSFTVDGHELRGYVDEQDRLVRIRTVVPGNGGEATDVIESFFDWTERGGLTFPSTLIRKENGELAEVLVVQEIEAGTSG